MLTGGGGRTKDVTKKIGISQISYVVGVDGNVESDDP